MEDIRTDSFHAHLFSLVVDDPWTQPSLLICSVVLGVLACRTIYKAMKVVGPLVPQYSRLSKNEKIEWDNSLIRNSTAMLMIFLHLLSISSLRRGFSTAHALMISAASMYYLFCSELFSDEAPYGPVVFRSSMMAQMILGISVGYFISDLAMILWFYPMLGGTEYIGHHLLSMASLCVCLYTGEGKLYVYMVLLSEITTPFVNLRWYFSVAGMKDTRVYLINGMLLFFGWMVARVLLFAYFFIHVYAHYDEVKLMSPVTFCCIVTAPPCLAMLNLTWFYKVSRGLLRTLSKRV